MSKPFRLIIADPAWSYKDKLTMRDGVARSSDSQYATMSVKEIQCLAVGVPMLGRQLTRDLIATPGLFAKKVHCLRIAGFDIADEALLALWTTNPFLLDGSAASVVKAWGFEPKQLVTWIKGRLAVGSAADPTPKLVPHVGMGSMTRGATEHVILATRGTGVTAWIADKGLPNFFVAPRGRHSEKPEKFFNLLERLVSTSCSPRLELFARKRRANWTSWGDQLPEEIA